MKKPLVSVMMPAFNAEAFLPESLGSLWAQDFKDFEVVVVDDGSSDGTWALLKARARREPRLRVFRSPKNRGITAARNATLARARGRYLALLDADDRAHSRRLELQVARLDGDPGLGVLGSAVRLWQGSRLAYAGSPEGHARIKAALGFRNVIANSSVMMRRSTMGAWRWREGYYAAEDYELWCRLALRTRMDNLPEALVDYRVHPQQSGPKRAMDQYGAAARIRRAYLAACGFKATAAQWAQHAALCPPFESAAPGGVAAARAWLIELLEQNRRIRAFDPDAFLGEARERFAAVCALYGLPGLFRQFAEPAPLHSWRHAFSVRQLKAMMRPWLRQARR